MSEPVSVEVVGQEERELAVLERMRDLARRHALSFRLEVGRLVLETWFDADPDLYRSRAPDKDGSLRAFAQNHADALADMDLGLTNLRNCVVAHLVVRDLDPDLVRKLLFSQVVELSRVEDRAARAALADMTVREGWTVRELRHATAAILENRWVDADPEAEGLQPPAPTPPPRPAPQPGRVVTRMEKAKSTLDDLLEDWAQVSSHRFSGRERDRMRKAIEDMEARLAALKSQVGP